MNNPERTSAFRRLEQLPPPAEMLKQDATGETSFVRYTPASDPEDPPRYDSPFDRIRSRSAPVRQVTMPPEQTYAGSDAVWMTQEELAAEMARVEAEEVERLLQEAESADRRQLKLRYNGPDGEIKLTVKEASDGQNIARILGALSGSSSPLAPSQPALPPQIPIRQSVLPPQYRAISATPNTSLYGTSEAEDCYEDEQFDQPVEDSPIETLGSMLEESEYQRARQSIDAVIDVEQTKKQKEFNALRVRNLLVTAALVAVCIRPAMDVVYEIAKAGINKDLPSVSTLTHVAFSNDPINEEKE